MPMRGKHTQKNDYSFQKASLNKVHKATESLGEADSFIHPNGVVPQS